jgi:cation transport protein ChaC
MLEQVIARWGGHQDLWVFGYGSLIWRPEFDYVERRPARVNGWHRALKMWSRINRGTPDCPGLVFGLLTGGSCQGMVFRIAREQGREVLVRLWAREMVTGVYDPRWLTCHTPAGPVAALAFTLSRKSPNHTGVLSPEQYRRIFSDARGRYGTTLEYAQRTYEELLRHQIRDRHLERLLQLAREA